MDPFLFLMAGIGLAVPLLAKALFHTSICWKEWLLQTGILSVVLVLAFLLAHGAQTSDTRIQNGEVTNKYRDRVSCSHSYSCNCRSVTRGDTTTRECDTCYEHTHDYDWVLATSVGQVLIDRIDRQGRREPQRFTAARIGDPVAVTERWTNYVQAAPHSVFHEPADPAYDDAIPPYPETIHDYHYLDRVFLTGNASVPDFAAWNHDLANHLKTIGRSVRGNVIVVITDIATPRYADALERRWLRGTSNDTVVVLSIDDTQTIAWARAFGWSENLRLYLDLRDRLEGTPLDRSTVLSEIEQSVLAHFVPLPADHFAYLRSEITLPGFLYVLLGLLALGLSTATTYYFHRNETFVRRRRF